MECQAGSVLGLYLPGDPWACCSCAPDTMLSENRHWRLHTPKGPLTSRDTFALPDCRREGVQGQAGAHTHTCSNSHTHTQTHVSPHTPTRTDIYTQLTHATIHSHIPSALTESQSHTVAQHSFPSIFRVTFTHSHPPSYLSLTLMSQSSPSPCLQPLTITHAQAQYCSWLTYGHMPQMPGHCGPHASPLSLSLHFSISVSLFLSLSTPELLSQPVEEAGLTLCP